MQGTLASWEVPCWPLLHVDSEPERQVEVGLSASVDITVKVRFAFDGV